MLRSADKLQRKRKRGRGLSRSSKLAAQLYVEACCVNRKVVSLTDSQIKPRTAQLNPSTGPTSDWVLCSTWKCGNTQNLNLTRSHSYGSLLRLNLWCVETKSWCFPLLVNTTLQNKHKQVVRKLREISISNNNHKYLQRSSSSTKCSLKQLSDLFWYLLNPKTFFFHNLNVWGMNDWYMCVHRQSRQTKASLNAPAAVGLPLINHTSTSS